MWIEVLKYGITVLLSGGATGFFIKLLLLKPDKKKIEAEAHKVKAEGDAANAETTRLLTETAASLVGPMKQQVDYLSSALAATRHELELANAQIEEMTRHIAEERKLSSKTIADLKTQLEELKKGGTG